MRGSRKKSKRRKISSKNNSIKKGTHRKTYDREQLSVLHKVEMTEEKAKTLERSATAALLRLWPSDLYDPQGSGVLGRTHTVCVSTSGITRLQRCCAAARTGLRCHARPTFRSPSDMFYLSPKPKVLQFQVLCLT